MPVRHQGKTYRFIASGSKAALFGKGGTLDLSLNVTETAVGNRLPKVETLEGDSISFARGSRPCSCKGAPWNTPFATLESQL